MAKEIPLSRDFTAIVDDSDYLELSGYKWWADKEGYALTTILGLNKKQNIRMHRLILSAPRGSIVDHIDGKPWNNQRQNLRIVTQRQNLMNTKPRKNKSGFKGVGWYPAYQMWQVRVHLNGKANHVGYFKDPIEAARAYNVKALELFGEFARLNEIPNEEAA